MSNPFFMVCRTTAIRRLLPTALFIDQGTHIEWLPENKAGTLTEEEITAEVTKMQAEFDALEWARNRASEYPPMDEQLDQLYHDMADGKLGVAATTSSWYVGITSVKNAYPKPS